MERIFSISPRFSVEHCQPTSWILFTYFCMKLCQLLFMRLSIGTIENKNEARSLKMLRIHLGFQWQRWTNRIETPTSDVRRWEQIWPGNSPECWHWKHLPHQLEAYTQMIPKVEVVQHVNDVVRSVGILFAEFIENSNLDEGLMVEALLVANDFDCDVMIRFVVQCANHLAEASLSNHFQDLVAVTNVIVNDLKRERF